MSSVAVMIVRKIAKFFAILFLIIISSSCFSHHNQLVLFPWNLLRSPGLFSVFWPISAILRFGWSRFFFWLSVCPPIFVSQTNGTLPSSPSTINITVTYTFYFFLSPSSCLSFTFLYFLYVVHHKAKSTRWQVFFC